MIHNLKMKIMNNLIEVSLYWDKERIEQICGINSLSEERWEELKEVLIDRLEDHCYDYGKQVIQMVVSEENFNPQE